MGVEEKRKAQRFPLDLPLQIKWQERSVELEKPATMQDISASGIFFLVDRKLEPDSKVEFYIRLQVEGAPEGGVLLHCVGSVVRVAPSEGAPGTVGVGARIDRYRFLRPGEWPADLRPAASTS